jgi:hypothetical protein
MYSCQIYVRDAMLMTKRQTGTTRNISNHKRMLSSGYQSYVMFGDAGVRRTNAHTSPTTAVLTQLHEARISV